MSRDYMLSLLDTARVPYSLHSHPVWSSLKEVEENEAFPCEGMVKTVAFVLKPSTWVLAAVPAYSRVDYRKLAGALGVKRSSLVQPLPQILEAEMGYQPGGVAPIAPREGVLLVYDTEMAGLGTVSTGSGRADATIVLQMADLQRLVKPLIASIVVQSEEARVPQECQTGQMILELPYRRVIV